MKNKLDFNFLEQVQQEWEEYSKFNNAVVISEATFKNLRKEIKDYPYSDISRNYFNILGVDIFVDDDFLKTIGKEGGYYVIEDQEAYIRMKYMEANI